MKGKRDPIGLVMAAALAFFCAGWAGQNSPEKTTVKPNKPLIRIDLLLKKAEGRASVRRDLFSPQSPMGNEGLPLVVPKVKTAPPAEEVAPAESEAPSIILHYIGYSYNETKKKFVALVFFQEQVTAVEEGDILPLGWKILKITAKDLEIEGPDKKSQRYSLEGDRR